MGKAIALLVFILWALASMAGYIYLTGKITAGERQIAEGQEKFDKGQIALKKGIARLEAGKQELAEGKKEYKHAKDNRALVIMDKWFKGGKGFRDAETKIAEGDKQVAKGEDKVNAGERRLDAGELELGQGREQLGLAKGARIACAIGAAFFSSLSIVLGFWWRRSLARIFKHTHA
jgi:uncharacterized phage infection (PIP) family protein YhgE